MSVVRDTKHEAIPSHTAATFRGARSESVEGGRRPIRLIGTAVRSASVRKGHESERGSRRVRELLSP